MMGARHGRGGGSRAEWLNPDKILKVVGVSGGMVVADLGCGPGYFSVPMASMVGKEGLVYAVDSDPLALDRLREGAESNPEGERGTIRIVQSDVTSTGIPNGSVDIAFFANVLHDITDKAAFLCEVKRILKPSGTAVDVDWRRAPMEVGPPFEMRLDEASVTEILWDNGFGVARTLDVGPFHYGLAAVRRPP